MALEGKVETRTIDGKETNVFLAEFTNGTVEQLKELATFLEKEGLDVSGQEHERLRKVVEVGIAWLERIRKGSEKKTEEAQA